MGIRLKLFAPMLLLIVVVTLILHFYWLPNYLEGEKENFLKHERYDIDLLSTALTPGLLTNDISQIYATLNNVLMDRYHWYAIRLYNTDNIRIFPLKEKAIPKDSSLKKIEHSVIYDNHKIARMEFWINVDDLLKDELDNIRKLEAILLGLILVISVSATYLQDRWVRKPLRQLLNFANQLARGHYNASIDYHSRDELGRLISSLESMRDKINEREQELQTAYFDLSQANSQLEHQSNTDALTMIYNRRYFDEMLARELSRNSRMGTPIALILCDIDYFKQYNDTYGHQEGDHCLRRVAMTIQGSFSRTEDVVTRYGGEEFGIILPNTDRDQAIEMAEEMQRQVSDLEIPHKSSCVADHVTISVGVGVIRPGKDTVMATLIEEADRALYQAKNEGRNLIRVSVG